MKLRKSGELRIAVLETKNLSVMLIMMVLTKDTISNLEINLPKILSQVKYVSVDAASRAEYLISNELILHWQTSLPDERKKQVDFALPLEGYAEVVSPKKMPL